MKIKKNNFKAVKYIKIYKCVWIKKWKKKLSEEISNTIFFLENYFCKKKVTNLCCVKQQQKVAVINYFSYRIYRI